jgi:hypothetical protein
MKHLALVLPLLLAACATTEFQPYEARNPEVQGNGGSKVVVDGMEIWDNGDPPRKFKMIGIINDSRNNGIIPMANLRGDIVRKAREAGGDAVIKIHSESQINGYVNTGTATANAYGNNATAYGTGVSVAARKNISKYAVIQYLD